jgi:hypothetical protein
MGNICIMWELFLPHPYEFHSIYVKFNFYRIHVLKIMQVTFQKSNKLRRRHFGLFSTTDIQSYCGHASSIIVSFHALCMCKILWWLYPSVSNTTQDTNVTNVTYIYWFVNWRSALLFNYSSSITATFPIYQSSLAKEITTLLTKT